MLLGEMVKARDCIAEGAGIANMFPGKSGEAGCDFKHQFMQISVFPTQEHSLQRGVIGVFTGLTRTLSR